MKIALVHNLNPGGAKRAIYELARCLTHQGHTVDVYQLSITDDWFLPLTPYVNRVITSEIEAFRLWQTRLLPFVIQYLNYPRKISYLRKLERLYAAMARDIDRQQYDVVFVHPCKVVKTPYVLRYLQTPSVFYCHDEPPQIVRYLPGVYRKRLTKKQKIQNIWYAPINWAYQQRVFRDDRKNAQAATLMLANSYFIREAIYRAYQRDARVNYLGVDTQKFCPEPIAKEPIVLAVGRTYPEKGYDFLIQALAYIPATRRPRLVILADMRDPREEQYFARLAQEKQVEFTIQSVFSDPELVRWYCQAQLFVYGARMEPFGLAPLEAMACGLPVVAVKEGGVRETILDGQTGFLTQRDPQEFAEKVRLLLENSALRRQYGEQARRYVETSWTWERSGQELLENFRRVCP